MTSVQTPAPIVRDAPAPPRLRSTRLVITIAVHAVVDFFSYLLIPIMSVLEGRLSITPAQGAIVLGVGSIASGFVQPLVAWLQDRFDSRLVGVGAFLAAVIAVSLVGYAASYEHLLLIQVVGSAGIGAFHPVAAAAVGQLSGSRRSAGVAAFFCAGMAGGVLGNFTSPTLQATLGLRAYAWLIIPGAVSVAALAWAIARAPHRGHDAHLQHEAWSSDERRSRWLAIALLYTGNVLRFTVNMMMVQLVIRWSDALALSRAGLVALDDASRDQSARVNGLLQGAMQLGMAVGGMSAGAALRAHHEKAALIAVPLFGAGAIALFPLIDALPAGAPVVLLAFALSAVIGLGYAGVVPVTIAMAQRLLPHRTGLASGLMMGGAWGFAAIGPPIAQGVADARGLPGAFFLTAGVLAASATLSLTLSPRLLERIAPH